jgi:hypothetical protein
VGAAAAALASLSDEPMFATFSAAAAIASGTATTNDIYNLQQPGEWGIGAQSTTTGS